MLSLLLPTFVMAQEMNNAQLTKLLTAMSKKLDAAVAKIDKIEAEANKSKAEAAVAKAEAAQAKRELAQIKANRTVAAEPRESTGSGVVTQAKSDKGATASLGMVYMRPSRSGLDYVVVDTQKLGPNSITGTYDSVDPGYDIGARLNVGYDFGNGVDLGAQYTHLTTRENSSVDNLTTGHELWGIWLHANSIIDDNDVDIANASYDLDSDVFDFTAGKKFGIGKDLGLRLDAGLRYAHIGQGMDVTYEQVVTPTTSRYADITYRNTFSGLGPKVGLGVDWQAGNGFTLFGALSGSVLVGDFDMHLKQIDTQTTGAKITRVDAKNTYANRVVPVVEMLAGVEYSRQLNNGALVGAKFGYEWQNWYNMVSTQHYTDDVDSQLGNTDTTDLGFDGFFLKGYIKY
jgi:DNA-binding protein H-NS